MTNIEALDLVIGLIFIYLLYSLLVSIIQEIIATNLGFRAKVLEKGIIRMLQDQEQGRIRSWLHLIFNIKQKGKFNLSDQFYSHPLIRSLAEDKWFSKPSYLTAQNFSKVMIDLLRGKNLEAGDSFREQIQSALKKKTIIVTRQQKETEVEIDPDTLEYLNSIWIDAQGDVDRFRKNLERWFDDTMERTGGWYKKYTQAILFVVGFFVAMSFNVDTVLIVKKLSKDPALREQLVKQADTYVRAHPNLKADLDASKKRIDEALASKTNKTPLDSAAAKAEKEKEEQEYKKIVQRNQALAAQADSLIKKDLANISGVVGLGWSRMCDDKNTKCSCECPLRPAGWNALTIPGWILTALALSLGAPFWFDLLNKLMQLRGNAHTEDSKKSENSNSGTQAINPKG